MVRTGAEKTDVLYARHADWAAERWRAIKSSAVESGPVPPTLERRIRSLPTDPDTDDDRFRNIWKRDSMTAFRVKHGDSYTPKAEGITDFYVGFYGSDQYWYDGARVKTFDGAGDKLEEGMDYRT